MALSEEEKAKIKERLEKIGRLSEEDRPKFNAPKPFEVKDFYADILEMVGDINKATFIKTYKDLDSIKELKSICKCGRKATVNARFNNGKLVVDGDEIMLGGNDSYEAICFSCYKKLKQEALNNKDENN